MIIMPKRKLSITVDSELIKWIDEEIEKKRFSSRSHGFEFCVNHVKVKEKRKEP